MQRVRREHARGRGQRFSRHGCVPFQQVQNCSRKARNDPNRQPLHPDWNAGSLRWMPANVNRPNTATTGRSPAGNAIHWGTWAKNCLDLGTENPYANRAFRLSTTDQASIVARDWFGFSAAQLRKTFRCSVRYGPTGFVPKLPFGEDFWNRMPHFGDKAITRQ